MGGEKRTELGGGGGRPPHRLGIAERRMEVSRDVDPLLPVTHPSAFDGIDRRMNDGTGVRWISIVQEGHPWIGKDTDSCRPSISEARRMRSVRRIHPREIGFQRLAKALVGREPTKDFYAIPPPVLRTRFLREQPMDHLFHFFPSKKMIFLLQSGGRSGMEGVGESGRDTGCDVRARRMSPDAVFA